MCTLWHCLSLSVFLRAWQRTEILEFKYESSLNLFGQLKQVTKCLLLIVFKSKIRVPARYIMLRACFSFIVLGQFSTERTNNSITDISILNHFWIFQLILFLLIYSKIRLDRVHWLTRFCHALLTYSSFLPQCNLEFWSYLSLSISRSSHDGFPSVSTICLHNIVILSTDILYNYYLVLLKSTQSM